MNNTRRDFLRGTAWMGLMAMAGGCASNGLGLGAGGKMGTFRAPRIPKVRVGVTGCGGRGSYAIKRISAIPGIEVVGVCDLYADRTAKNRTWLKEHGRAEPKEYVGPEAYRKLCDRGDVDVIYNTTSWDMHAPICLYAMRAGKHTFCEVPSVYTLDEAWELVETSEATERHCMMLENCCYGEYEMLALNLCATGALGEIVHGEGAYIHDLRSQLKGESEPWRVYHNREHKGNQYPTHGLGPIAMDMGINRGDRFDYLVSLESGQFNDEAYAKAVLPENSPHKHAKFAMGDMNSTLIKTVKGRSILVQHDVSSPRPYSRINLISGTKGILRSYPDLRVVLEAKPGAGAHKFLDEAATKEFREKYRHPLWKQAGAIAAKVGGHGGMDFMMDLRWAYCLQNGLPLDMNVYDLASWSCLCELTEKSVRGKSACIDIPDFTRGGWKTAETYPDLSIDLAKMGLGPDSVKATGTQQKI